MYHKSLKVHYLYLTQIYYDKQELALPSTFFSACDVLNICLGILKNRERVGQVADWTGELLQLTLRNTWVSLPRGGIEKLPLYLLCYYGLRNASLHF